MSSQSAAISPVFFLILDVFMLSVFFPWAEQLQTHTLDPDRPSSSAPPTSCSPRFSPWRLQAEMWFALCSCCIEDTGVWDLHHWLPCPQVLLGQGLLALLPRLGVIPVSLLFPNSFVVRELYSGPGGGVVPQAAYGRPALRCGLNPSLLTHWGYLCSLAGFFQT